MKCKISAAHRHKITIALAKEIKKLEMLAEANNAELCRLMLNGAFEALRDDLEIQFPDSIEADGLEEAISIEEETSLSGVEFQTISRSVH